MPVEGRGSLRTDKVAELIAGRGRTDGRTSWQDEIASFSVYTQLSVQSYMGAVYLGASANVEV